jgi:hypothetical protein
MNAKNYIDLLQKREFVNTTKHGDDSDDKEEKVKFHLLCAKISEIFPDYLNDESFGGNKKYIRIVGLHKGHAMRYPYAVRYINPYLIERLKYHYDNEEKDDGEIRFEDVIDEYVMDKNVADDLQYFDKLIHDKTIRVNKIYDINSSEFVYKINKTKFAIDIEGYDNFKAHLKNIKEWETGCNTHEQIRQLFHCNMIINDCLYCTMTNRTHGNICNIFKHFKNLKEFDTLTVDVGINDYIPTTIYKINSKYYDYETYLKKYAPYLIRWTAENDYYVLNRNYEYIGLNTKAIAGDTNGDIYIFRAGTEPWRGKMHMIAMTTEYEKTIKEHVKENGLQKWLNPNEFTQNILSLKYDINL